MFLADLTADLIEGEFMIELLEKKITDIDPPAFILLNEPGWGILYNDIFLCLLFLLSAPGGILFCPEIRVHITGKHSDFFKGTDIFDGPCRRLAVNPNGFAEIVSAGRFEPFWARLI